MEIKNVANLQVSVKMTESQKINQQANLQMQKSSSASNENQQLKKISPKDIEKILEDLQKKISLLNTQLKIEVEKVGDNEEIPVVKVIDKTTNKVIRQIPPEYMLKIAKYIDEITGLLLREKV
ncbi:flagellar protein FlaG [Desulfurobacterium atlanticum]|uniref:Flagellar protein FlaG n=1 Tax=Desulfurobacterium atlanticum TaxID=240169 RepID=A0A238ZF42_9BACT|nr:flagellar protein FlaG [Desulfurobacterium atlanticum]SNR81997.1 flagellar protein FlaG [Desulfurobacterium atlanticum]